ncbi:MAG: cupin domain-containing protein [Nitrososphaerota archaeon]
MIIDLGSAKPVIGDEGTQIRQIFHPHNTMLGIRYSMVKCTLEPGKKSKPHILKSSEVYFIVKGNGVLHIDSQDHQVRADHAAYVPPHSEQFIENTGTTPLEFLCIVDPAWRKEDEAVVQ